MTAACSAVRKGLLWSCAAAWALGALVLATPLNEILSRPAIDWQLRALSLRAPLTGVTVIDIDEPSLQALQKDFGSWPYSRDVYALAIDELRRSGVRAIAFDLLLADERAGDAAMAREIARAGAPVLLSAIGLGQGREPLDTAAAADIRWAQLVQPAASLLPPIRPAARVGVVTMPLDSDGHLRRWPLWHEAGGQRWPALPLAVWQTLHAADALAWPPQSPSRLTIALGDGAGAVNRLPFSTLMDVALLRAPRAALAERLRDQVVFVGAGALLADNVLTPGGPVGGTEALAQAYANLRERRLLRLPRPAWDATLAVLAGLPVILAALRRKSTLRQGLSLLALVALLLTGFAAMALWGYDQLVQPAAAVATLLGSALLLAAWRQVELVQEQRQLLEQRRLAEAANQAKTEFLANISHEIRTPMSALLGAAELLSRSHLQPAQKRLVDVFTDTGRTLEALLNDLLDLSRADAGRLTLHAAPFSLQASLSRVVELVRLRAERKGVALPLQLAADLPAWVQGDSQRLEQVLLNLLTNSVKFTEKGSVRLAVERQGDQVTFTITDTGIGIAADKLPLIFEPFTQADGSITRHYGGSGLGLSIVNKLTQIMGGEIEARSEPGQGSCFTLRLPLPQAQEPPAEPPRAAATGAEQADRPSDASYQALNGLRLLLVEDNEINVMIFCAMLQKLDVQVDVAGNGVEGLERLRQKQYDLVCVDIQMPVMDGMTMTQQLRREESSQAPPRRVPVIALTANADTSDARLSLEAGCDLHIAKPYSREQLLQALCKFAPELPRNTHLQGTTSP